MNTVIDPVQRLTKDLKQAAATLSHDEARYLVDCYYVMQRDRIRAGNQVRAASEGEEPHAVLRWFSDNTEILEGNIRRALDAYTDAQVVGIWSKSIVGIGPVLAAGLLAHIDLEPWRCLAHKLDAASEACHEDGPHPGCGRARLRTVGQIWRYAGLDPTCVWGKGQKRPWNARLKTLCWKLGESFVKQSGHQNDVYGKLYLQRKALEQERNAAGVFAAQAAAALAAKRYGADTRAREHYHAGHLPPARLHLRAQRWAVKIFLAHWFHVAYESRFGTPPAKPYVLTHLGHVDEIHIPNWPMR